MLNFLQQEQQPTILVQSNRDILLHDSKAFYNLQSESHIKKSRSQKEDPSLQLSIGKDNAHKYFLVRYSSTDQEVFEIQQENLVQSKIPVLSNGLESKSDSDEKESNLQSTSDNQIFDQLLQVWKKRTFVSNLKDKIKNNSPENFLFESEDKSGQLMNESIVMGDFFDFNKFKLAPKLGVPFENQMAYLHFKRKFKPRSDVLKINFFNFSNKQLDIQVNLSTLKRSGFYLINNQPNNQYLEHFQIINPIISFAFFILVLFV